MKLIEMSVSASCLILLLVLLRTMLLYRVLKRTFVVLWDLALLRLLLPVTAPQIRLPASAQPIASPVPQIAQTVTEAAQGVTVLLPQTEAARQIPWPAILWAVGAILCAALFLAGHWTSSRRYRMSLPIEEPVLEEWMQEQLLRPVRIRQSDQIGTPLTYGILRPVILLPKELRTGREEMACILLHELVHIRRFDTLRKWLLAAAVCLHWFNPLVWLLYTLANRDMELACDEAVLQQLGPEGRRDYANLLIGLEAWRSGLSPLAAGFSRRPMEERITAIMKIKKKTAISLGLAAVLVLGAVTAFVGLDASAAETVDKLPTLEQQFSAPKEPAQASESGPEWNAAAGQGPEAAVPETPEAEADTEADQWLEAYAGLGTEEQNAVLAFCDLVEQLYGEDIRSVPVTLAETTAAWHPDTAAWQLNAEIGTRSYSGWLLQETGVWEQMMCTDDSIRDTDTLIIAAEAGHPIDPSSDIYQTIAALACLDPENGITQIGYLNGGQVNTQRADWYAVTRENGANLEAILGQASGALIGFKQYPADVDVSVMATERG